MAKQLYECPNCSTRRYVDDAHHDRFLCMPMHHHVTGIFSDSLGCGKTIFLPGKNPPTEKLHVAKLVAPDAA